MKFSGGGTETELYSCDIEDYVVTFPRPSQPKNWSEGNDYGKPVVMITGGAYHLMMLHYFGVEI